MDLNCYSSNILSIILNLKIIILLYLSCIKIVN
nr:MAG TPA: hypothetical protein [Ackermannviridae sp.]